MTDWTIVSPASDGPGTQEVLEKLSEAAGLYDRYLQLTSINIYPVAAELEPTPDLEEPTTRPLGLVLDPTPMGVAVVRRL